MRRQIKNTKDFLIMNKIKKYKSRKINYSKPVYIYRNLNKGIEQKVYSIKQENLVVGHSTALTLKDIKFIVNKAGQAKVRKEKRKQVHAYIFGLIDKNPPEYQHYPYQIFYNPYKNKTFVALSDMTNMGGFNTKTYKVNYADYVIIEKEGVFAAGINYE